MSHLLEFLFEVFCGGTKLGSFSFKRLQFPLALMFSLITSFFCFLNFQGCLINGYNLLQSDSWFSFCCAFADKSTETIILSPWVFQSTDCALFHDSIRLVCLTPTLTFTLYSYLIKRYKKGHAHN